MYLREPATLKAAVRETNEFATIRGGVETKPATVNAIDGRQALKQENSRIANLESKVDSLVEAMKEMFQRGPAPQQQPNQVNPINQTSTPYPAPNQPRSVNSPARRVGGYRYKGNNFNPNYDPAKVTCYNCRGIGHISWHCPARRNENPGWSAQAPKMDNDQAGNYKLLSRKRALRRRKNPKRPKF